MDNTRWTQSGHKADQNTRCGLESKVRSQQHKADSWRTHTGHKADNQSKRCEPTTQGGHKADSWWTSSGGAAKAYRGQPFFLRENPTVNCLGKNLLVKGKMDQKVRSLGVFFLTHSHFNSCSCLVVGVGLHLHHELGRKQAQVVVLAQGQQHVVYFKHGLSGLRIGDDY